MTKAKKTVARQSEGYDAADNDDFDQNESVASKNASSILDLSLEPINSPEMAFCDMVKRFLGDLKLIADNGGISINVATMCSGTEAPIFALQMLKEAFDEHYPHAPFLHFNHEFSVEIVPFKQAYLERNTARSNKIFRDVRDFKSEEAKDAFTPLGLKTEIPTNIDVLVAGTSCVDFSTLNNKKTSSMGVFVSEGHKLMQEWRKWNPESPKGVRRPKRPTTSVDNIKGEPRPQYWEEARQYVLDFGRLSEEETDGKAFGQSTLTFLSLLNYAHWHRPKVIFLENVNGAPWREICGFFFRAIGYNAVYEHVDSKEFYTPQTRTRGYAVAVDLHHFGADADEILNKWKIMMGGELRRRASSSISHWLLPPNDPLALRARQSDTEAALSKSKRKDTDWDRSELRHNRTRRDLQLGQGNPITAWKLGTDHPPYDRMDRLIKGLWSSRALDCIDMIHLSCLKSGTNNNNSATRFDMRFKTQIYDISQNIDRTMVSKNFGVSVCLTPNGAGFITDQVRPVSGYEYLRLQGLPLQSLDLLKEDQDQLRDLGGNAMTTTVIGAAFVALFRSIGQIRPQHEWFRTITPDEAKMALETKSDDESVFKPKRKSKISINPIPLYRDMEVYSSDVDTYDKDSLIEVARRARRYCFCSQSAKYSSDHLKHCTACGTIRCQACYGNPPHSFQDYPAVQNSILYDTVVKKTMKYLPVSLDNIIGNTREGFRSHFDAQEGDDLYESVVSATFHFEEILVTEQLTICYSTRGNRCVLNLQCVVDGEKVQWYLWIDAWCAVGQELRKRLKIPREEFCHPFARLSIENTQDYIPKMSVWDLWTFKKAPCWIKVTRPQREQILVQVLLAPSEKPLHLQRIEGLYKQRPDCDVAENSLYVLEENEFKERIFLFKDPTKIMSPELDGFVIAPECRVLERHEFRQRLFVFPLGWDHTNEDHTNEVIEGHVFGHWQSFSKAVPDRIRRNPDSNCVGTIRILNAGHPNARRYTNQQFQLGMKPSLLAELALPRRSQPDSLGVLSKYQSVEGDSWALVPKKEHSAVFGLFAPLNTRLHQVERALKFEIFDDGAGDFDDIGMPPVGWLQRTGLDNIREPYRSSGAVESYDRRVRSRRQAPFKVFLQTGAESEIEVRYCIQPDELVLDAVSFLGRANGWRDDLEAWVEVGAGELNVPQMKFNSFKNYLRPLSPTGSRLRASFINDKQLSPQQEVSLTWMFNLERTVRPNHYVANEYTMREVQEHGIEALNLRIAGVAQTRRRVQGGILADQVGYGKTIVSLALMQKGEADNFDSGTSTSVRSQFPGLALPGSLVLAPKHLVTQWSSEAMAFLGWTGREVVTINSSKDLQSQSAEGSRLFIERMKGAKLIIVNTDVFDLRYYAHLAKYAGTFGPPSPSNLPNVPKDDLLVGAFKHWYEHAIVRARANVNGFDPETFNVAQLDVIKSQMQHLVSENTALVNDYDTSQPHDHVPKEGTTRCPGCVYVPSTPTSVCAEDFTTQVYHFLEAFSYARIFYDEFSYENPCASYFFKRSMAISRWVLSATAPTADLRAVCSIAELFQVHVARPAMMRPGLPLITRGPADLSKSSADEHLAYNTFHSDKAVQDRMSQGAVFLEKFASANAFDSDGFGAIEVTQTVHVVCLSLGELAGYLDLLRALRDAEFEVKKTLSHDGLQHLNARDQISAGELLAYTASVFSGFYYVSPRNLLQRRMSELVLAQNSLKRIVDVSIWLALRRNREIRHGMAAKTNPSATSAIEDLVHFFQAIRNKETDMLGGTDAMKAISCALFVDGLVPSDIPDVVQITDYQSTQDLLNWLNTTTSRDSSPFFRSAAWASYLPVTENDINTTDDRDVTYLLRDLRVRLDITEMSESMRKDFTDLEPEDIRKFSCAEQRRLLIWFLAGVKSVTLRPKKKPTTRKRPVTVAPLSVEAQYDEVFETAKLPQYGKTTRVRGSIYTETEAQLVEINMEFNRARDNVAKLARQVRAIESLFYGRQGQRKCYACEGDQDLQLVTECGHIVCAAHIVDSEVRVCGDIRASKGASGSGCTALLRHRVIPVEQVDSCATEEEQSHDTEDGPMNELTAEEMQKRFWLNLPKKYQVNIPDPFPHITGEEVDDGTGHQNNSATNVATALGGAIHANNAVGLPHAHHLSSKTIAIIEKIHHIVTRLEERVLVFYQFERQLEELRSGLDRVEIPHQVLSADKNLTVTVQGGTARGSAVRFMKINGVEAAGSNFQDANHVIFTSAPVFSRQEDFDAYVNQAKGRAIRHGQQKHVRVYWYLSANTFEIDLLQLRLRSRIRLPRGQDEAHVIPWGSEDKDGEMKMTGTSDDDNVQYVNITSSISKDEVWRLTDETNWLVQQAIEF
ncbi:hypothetical protein F5Y18DRAFT_421974 [Xylariaceae sp. FL1019]|nr:hypothetical protein F5Y18DRAFT_421974 [Xylariaceae sp. FL1019]